jgi:hypothetical protein
MYRRSSCKIETTKTKQTITNNDLVVDLPTKILDENINIKKKFTIDGWKSYTVSSFQHLWPYFYTNKYRQIKFRMKVYNKIGAYKNKSITIKKI